MFTADAPGDVFADGDLVVERRENRIEVEDLAPLNLFGEAARSGKMRRSPMCLRISATHAERARDQRVIHGRAPMICAFVVPR